MKSTILWASFLTGALVLGITAYQNVQQSTLLVTGWASADCPGSVTTSSGADRYSMAYRESLGFFDDIPQEDWELMRNITLGRVNNHDPRNPLMHRHVASEWYQKNWDPDFSCRHDTKVGIGDGAKWVCDPHRLARQAQKRMEQYAQEGRLTNQLEGKEIRNGCLVYSVGSNGDFRFEEGIHNLIPGACEIHTFDFTNYAGRVPRGKNIYFHHWGIKPSYTETKSTSDTRFQQVIPANKPFKTFQETIKELGHEGRPIDVFKIDCEGCEWSTYKDWIGADMRQILVEVHLVPAIAQDFFSDLQKAGYVTYHKEPNIQWGGGECVEYAMLKLSTEYVEDRLAASKK